LRSPDSTLSAAFGDGSNNYFGAPVTVNSLIASAK
jgi:hypothetical protein